MPIDYASLMVEILKDNSRPDAGAIYGAIDMPWAKLVAGQLNGLQMDCRLCKSLKEWFLRRDSKLQPG